MKRFTETTKWDDPWFLDLSSDTKLFWLYLCDKCDNAGVIDIHERKAAFEMGCDSPIDNMLRELGNRVTTLDSGKYHSIRWSMADLRIEGKQESSFHRMEEAQRVREGRRNQGNPGLHFRKTGQAIPEGF